MYSCAQHTYTGASARTFCLANTDYVFFKGIFGNPTRMFCTVSGAHPARTSEIILVPQWLPGHSQPLRKKSERSVGSLRKCFCISTLILLFCSLAWKAWAWHLVCSEVPPFPQRCSRIAEAHRGQETVHKVIQWLNASIQTQSQHLLDSWFFVLTRRLTRN